MFPATQQRVLIPSLAVLVLAAHVALSPPLAQAAHPAGLAPNVRPAQAPVVATLAGADARRANALRGIGLPAPDGLRFLDSQGAWYTPFDRPGMSGRYDLRGWHAPATARR